MAMAAGGGLSAWRCIADSTSRVRFVCGVEPTRKPQQSISGNSDYPSSSWPRRLSIASSGDAALRCQAATMTAARETTDVEMRGGLQDARAALHGSFEAACATGCGECGPVSQEEARFVMAEPVAARGEAQRLYHGRRGGGDGYYLAVATKAAKLAEETPTIGMGEVLASFEAALHEAGRNAQLLASLAARAWRSLGDADRAEALYLKALELAPQDSVIHASYAEFLWQCDV